MAIDETEIAGWIVARVAREAVRGLSDRRIEAALTEHAPACDADVDVDELLDRLVETGRLCRRTPWQEGDAVVYHAPPAAPPTTGAELDQAVLELLKHRRNGAHELDLAAYCRLPVRAIRESLDRLWGQVAPRGRPGWWRVPEQPIEIVRRRRPPCAPPR